MPPGHETRHFLGHAIVCARESHVPTGDRVTAPHHFNYGKHSKKT